MKRVFAMGLALALCLAVFVGLAPRARAESAASQVDIQAAVSAQGDASVTMGVTLRMEAAQSSLYFPLPTGARNVSVNGSPAATIRSGSSLDVDLSRITRDYIGDTMPIQITYTLPEAVAVAKVGSDKAGYKNVLMLTLPLLNGFELPIERFNFTITLPTGKLTHSPEFYSTYRQGSLASDLNAQVSGSQIIVSSKTTLHDHDGVIVTMQVPESMFPTVSTYIREGEPEVKPMLICFGAAMVFWILFLFSAPLRPIRTATPPEGIGAGELGCRLTMAGGDLTSMVFSWAQLGYLTIHMESSRVILYKRMDMGNERGAFENKVYGLLFGSRQAVDATGRMYANLCKKVARMHPSERVLYKSGLKGAKIFRAIACFAQLFAGVNVAMNMTDVPALEIILSVIFSAVGLLSAWAIQEMAYRTHLRGKVPVYYGLACIALWLILGIASGQVWVPLGCSLGQVLMGYFAAYGGRRSELGRHEAGMVLGLRQYLKHMPRDEISRILNNDPYYFFNLAPCALALGVINPFADAFGRRKMDCPYMTGQSQVRRTAEEWAKLITMAADRMDEKQRKMALEKLMAFQIRIDIARRED